MIKLKTLINEGIIKYFYHATICKFLPKIVTDGLIPSKDPHWGGDLGKFSEGKIFVADSFDMALFYGNAGIWSAQHYSQFKPILRFKYNRNKLIPDINTKGDYYSEISIQANFELFVPDEDDIINYSDRIIFNENKGHWRLLTKELANIIYYGEWDEEIIDNGDDKLNEGIRLDYINKRIQALEAEWEKIDSQGTGFERQQQIRKEIEQLRKEKIKWDKMYAAVNK